MKVSIDEIEAMQRERARVNKADLKEIVFTKDGFVLNIPLEVRKAFEFTGLNNIDFITSGTYKEIPRP